MKYLYRCLHCGVPEYQDQGIRALCKNCQAYQKYKRKMATKRWRQRNPAQYRALQRIYINRWLAKPGNREIHRARKRDWYRRNKQAAIEYNRRYRIKMRQQNINKEK